VLVRHHILPLLDDRLTAVGVIPNSSFTDRRNFYSKPGIVNYIYSNTPESLHDQVGKLATWSVVVFAGMGCVSTRGCSLHLA
jgi:hypothetical protein